MCKSTRLQIPLLFLTIAWLNLNVKPLQADTIYLNDSPPIQDVEILKETVEKVFYIYPGSSSQQSIEAERVKTITFSKAPKTFSNGLEAFQDGNYDTAIKKLNAAKKSYSKIKELLTPYCYFYVAESYRKLNRFSQAKQEYRYFEQNPKHRLAPIAKFWIGMLSLYEKDYPNAKQAFASLKNSPNKYWQCRALYGNALVNMEQGNYSQASKLFSKLGSLAGQQRGKSFKELKKLAQYGKGMVYVFQAKTSKAIGIFRKILRKATSQEVLARAYLGIGMAYYFAAKQGNQPKLNYKRAAIAFLRIILLYPDSTKEYATALHFAIRCFQKLNQPNRSEKLNALLQRVPLWARYRGAD